MAMFKGFKVVSIVYGVACKDSNKVDRCGVVSVVSVMMINWFVGVVDRWSGE